MKPSEIKERLEFLDMCIHFDVQNSLSSLALKWYMDQFFYSREDAEKRTLFRTNIANTFLYQANLAYFERCFLQVADHIHEALDQAPKLDITVLHRWDLKNHRDYLSHPGKVGQFDNPEMKKFVDERRYYKERKAILLWNARRSILETLREVESERPGEYPTDVQLQGGMGELVHGAIHYSLKDEVARPSLSDVVEVLMKFFAEFRQYQAAEADRQYKETTG